jgi:hypothetical protein
MPTLEVRELWELSRPGRQHEGNAGPAVLEVEFYARDSGMIRQEAGERSGSQ